jgi:ParB-like chromosome segregation protein Spo0J
MRQSKAKEKTKVIPEGLCESGQANEETKQAASPSNDAAACDDASQTGSAKQGGHAAERQTRWGRKAAQTPQTIINVTMLPVKQLRPNPLNPNTLTEEQGGELREEVRRLGRPAKAIVVRRLRKNRYEIVDGEHSWAAAKEIGLGEVPCEIIQADEFEALRQTYVRNLQGSRDPLRTGRLFQRMLELRGMSLESVSQREFARENNLNEATLRNYLLYARAAEVRNRYAPETGDDTIRGLSVAKVRQYLELPEDKRDEWLDRGAHSDEAAKILEAVGKKSSGVEERIPLEVVTPSTATDEPDNATGANGEEEDTEATYVEADGDGGGAPSNRARVDHEEEKPVAPLSPAEQEVVGSVLRSYREGRALVREKVLAGLAAYSDAVAFFRRMIEGGS